MYIHAHKTQEYRIAPVQNETSKEKHSGKSTSQLVDNRPEAIVQRKRQEVASNGQQVARITALQGELLTAIQQSHPVQMKTYRVSRKLPLEPHFKERPADKTENLQNDLLGMIRQDFLLSLDDEQKATKEKWTAEQRDARRPDGFEEAKKRVFSQLKPFKDDEGASTRVWTRGAHVSGLSVVSERSRANPPISTLTKKVTKMGDWIGAHLVKREWGGEDNMWNVVCWPEAAENAWGKRFEKPIDIAFAVRGQQKLNIEIQVDKEDEAVPKGELKGMLVDVAPKAFSGKESDIPPETESNAAALWHNANRGLERIPTFAKGESELGAATLDVSNTKWTDAKRGAEAELKCRLIDAWKVNARKRHVLRPDPGGSHAAGDREEERRKALKEERGNYRPERYDVTYDIPKP